MSTVEKLEARWTGALEPTSFVAAFTEQARLGVLTFIDVRAVSPRLIESVPGVADAKEVALLILATTIRADLFEQLALVDVSAFLFSARPGRIVLSILVHHQPFIKTLYKLITI